MDRNFDASELPFEFRHVVAVDNNGVIGDGESLLWRHRGDMAHFRYLTEYGTVLMGYNTYKSIPKALINRRMIVLTSDKSKVDTNDRNVIAISELPELLDHVPPFSTINVIGGGKVYHMTLPFTHAVYLSRLRMEVAGENLIHYPQIKEVDVPNVDTFNFINDDGYVASFTRFSASSYPPRENDVGWSTELYFRNHAE